MSTICSIRTKRVTDSTLCLAICQPLPVSKETTLRSSVHTKHYRIELYICLFLYISIIFMKYVWSYGCVYCSILNWLVGLWISPSMLLRSIVLSFSLLYLLVEFPMNERFLDSYCYSVHQTNDHRIACFFFVILLLLVFYRLCSTSSIDPALSEAFSTTSILLLFFLTLLATVLDSSFGSYAEQPSSDWPDGYWVLFATHSTNARNKSVQ